MDENKKIALMHGISKLSDFDLPDINDEVLNTDKNSNNNEDKQ
jgi:hypothetical protein